MNYDFNDETTKDLVKTTLREGVAEVTFTKVDGSERVMKCTLKSDLIPSESTPKGTGKTHSPETLSVFDVESNGWRSFRWNAVKKFDFV